MALCGALCGVMSAHLPAVAPLSRPTAVAALPSRFCAAFGLDPEAKPPSKRPLQQPHLRMIHMGAPQGAPQGVPRKPVFLCNFMDVWDICRILGNLLRVFGRKNVFLRFSKQNHAESSRFSFSKKQILSPKHIKIDQNSDFGNVLCVFRPDSGGRPIQDV